MRTRHPEFQGGPVAPALDPSPDALTSAEVTAIEDAMGAGYAPRIRLIRKMLRLTLRYQP